MIHYSRPSFPLSFLPFPFFLCFFSVPSHLTYLAFCLRHFDMTMLFGLSKKLFLNLLTRSLARIIFGILSRGDVHWSVGKALCGTNIHPLARFPICLPAYLCWRAGECRLARRL